MSLLRLVQDNGQKWWVIVIIFEKLMEMADPVNLELAHCNKSQLCMSSFDRADMKDSESAQPFSRGLTAFF